MLQIKDFLAYIRGVGFQRNNKFVISFNIPDAVMSNFNATGNNVLANAPSDGGAGLQDGTNTSSAGISKILSLMAVDVNTPGVNIKTAEQGVGVSRHIAEDRNTGELNITFRASANMVERKLFDAWVSTVYRDDSTVAYYDDYVTPTVDIFTLNSSGNSTYQVSMEEAYPTTVTELPLNAEQMDSILMFQVTFTYRRLNNGSLSGGSSNSLPTYADPNSPTSTNVNISSLPNAPSTNNSALFLIDVYKNIDRVKQAIESGTLNKAMGQKLILNIIRDINSAGVDTGISGQALTYANNLVYLLGKKG